MSDASLGTANILFLALLLQDLGSKEKGKELVSTILAIEEPEAHLHPHLQRMLFRYFLGRDRAVFLTTHSPNIASVTPINSLVLLRTTKKGSIALTSLKLKLNSQEENDLQRYLDVTRAEMLFAKGVVFVEGSAEQFILPSFASSRLKKAKLGNCLDEFGVSICSVNGTDFLPFCRLLSSQGFSIPYVVVTDGDLRKTEGKVIYEGILRGKDLLSEESRVAKTDSLIAEGNFSKAFEVLTEEGVYVGKRTLELDLVHNLSEEIKETYSDLQPSTRAGERFAELVDTFKAGDEEVADKLLNRIERIGKGRFCQRLSGKINNQDPPSYIAKAIDHIVKAVKESNA